MGLENPFKKRESFSAEVEADRQKVLESDAKKAGYVPKEDMDMGDDWVYGSPDTPAVRVSVKDLNTFNVVRSHEGTPEESIVLEGTIKGMPVRGEIVGGVYKLNSNGSEINSHDAEQVLRRIRKAVESRDDVNDASINDVFDVAQRENLEHNATIE